MFILLINCPFDDVISESQRKGTAVLGDGEIFAGLLPEVVATGAVICDKALMRLLNRVASIRRKDTKNCVQTMHLGCRIHKMFQNSQNLTLFCLICCIEPFIFVILHHATHAY